LSGGIVGFGAAGHAAVVIDALLASGGGPIVALLDANPNCWGRSLQGIPIIGGDDRLPELLAQGVTRFFVGVGMVGNHRTRARLFAAARAKGLEPVSVVHPAAIVSKAARIGAGPTICAGAIVNPGARLGDNVIVNTGAIVEHDCVIGDHAHVATGARLAGNVTVMAGAHIGVGASIRQGLTIGAGAFVAGGAMVIADVADETLVGGVPARLLRRNAGAR